MNYLDYKENTIKCVLLLQPSPNVNQNTPLRVMYVHIAIDVTDNRNIVELQDRPTYLALDRRYPTPYPMSSRLKKIVNLSDFRHH